MEEASVYGNRQAIPRGEQKGSANAKIA